jgi:hypothetical protein
MVLSPVCQSDCLAAVADNRLAEADFGEAISLAAKDERPGSFERFTSG